MLIGASKGKKLVDWPYFGWLMITITFMMGVFSFGVLTSVTVFITPLTAEFGWSRGAVSFGYTAVTLTTAFSAIFWAVLADRYGPRWITLFGAVCMGFILYGLSSISTLWEFYLYYLLFGALSHAALTGPLYASASLWFKRNVGLAIGLAVSGSAVGQGLIPTIARFLIDNYGWQSAYVFLGVGYLCLAIPIALLVRDTPVRSEPRSAAAPIQRDGTPFPLPPKVVVAWVACAVFFCCTAMSVPVVHLVPLLEDKGMTGQSAALVLLVLMIAGAMGRIFGGNLCDRIGALPAYALMSLGQTLVIFLFPHVFNSVAIYALAIAFGVFFSGVMASFLVCVRVMVPARVMARSMAVVGAAGWFGMGFGGWQGGAVFDVTGDYILSFANGSFAGIVNLLILAAFYFHIRDRSGRTPLQTAAA